MITDHSSRPSKWSDCDLVFVAAEISREFPSLELERVTSGVHQAAETVGVEEGRVALTIATRSILRRA